MAPGDCPLRVDHDSLVKKDGFLDLSIPVEDRPNLLDAFTVLPDPLSGNLFLVADAWNGSGPTAILVSLTKGLDPTAGCGAFEGFGCWLKYIIDGVEGSHLRTDGAACYDAKRKVLVATSIDQYSEEEPGAAHFFKVEADLQMTPWLQASNKSLPLGALPVATICH